MVGFVGCRGRARVPAFLAAILLFATTLEVTARLFWLLRGVPFFEPGKVLYAYYPEMQLVERAAPRRDGPLCQHR